VEQVARTAALSRERTVAEIFRQRTSSCIKEGSWGAIPR